MVSSWLYGKYEATAGRRLAYLSITTENGENNLPGSEGSRIFLPLMNF